MQNESLGTVGTRPSAQLSGGASQAEVGVDCVGAAIDTSHRRWPRLEAGTAELRGHLMGLRVAPSCMIRYGDELCLALQCARKHAYALRIFEVEYLQVAERAVARKNAYGGSVDDAMQELRIRLLVGPRPKIARYLATGPLLSWLSVAARRTALNVHLRQGRRREVSLLVERTRDEDETGKSQVSPYYATAQAELGNAVAALTLQERRLLELQVVGLNIDNIGAVCGVHRATAARRLAAIRLRIRKQVARQMQAHFQLSARDTNSVLTMVAEELSLQISSGHNCAFND